MIPRLRTFTAFALAAGLLFAASPATPAAAAHGASPATSVVSTPSEVRDNVQYFFEEYIPMARGLLPKGARYFRGQFFTDAVNTELDRWADTHHLDPILRSEEEFVHLSVYILSSNKTYATIVAEVNFASSTTRFYLKVPLDNSRVFELEDRSTD
ncbi:hypothetical protein [Streptomyces sp. NPDC088719]|uniref:hypothetical protein n=1 Tax=Streptomyces sp. NPDC088719 TaxID=3365872 RepID=UPI00380FA3D7